MRAASALQAVGARPITLPGQETVPAWAVGWEQMLAREAGALSTLYAFVRGDGLTPDQLRRRLDSVAVGLAGAGLLSSGILQLVAVVVLEGEHDPGAVRSLVGVTPHTFIANLRPTSWVVDLSRGRVVTPRFQRPEEARTLRQALSAADGDGIAVAPVDTGQFQALMRSRRPLATYALIVLNTCIYLYTYTRGGPTDATLFDMGALLPTAVEHGEWWRLFSSVFLHASVPHILFNMTSLYAIGTLAERLYGTARYLAIYLGAGLIGSLVSFGYAEVTGRTNVLGVGASGAIFGVAGALLTVRFQRSEVIPAWLRRRVSSSFLPLVAISLGISFLTPNVDNSAHIGGLIGGGLLSFLFPLVRSIPSQPE